MPLSLERSLVARLTGDSSCPPLRVHQHSLDTPRSLCLSFGEIR